MSRFRRKGGDSDFRPLGDISACARQTYDRKTAFMRVRWPPPCLLNHSNTSLSMRRCTEVLPLGMTTRARFQKSSPTAGASGALTRVSLAPRAAFLLIALSGVPVPTSKLSSFPPRGQRLHFDNSPFVDARSVRSWRTPVIFVSMFKTTNERWRTRRELGRPSGT